MKYLFFDLEFAASPQSGKKICEFGYVLVNEKFELIERLNLLINPNIELNEWDNYVVNKILTRSYLIYLQQPSFECFFEQIKKLFKKCDYIFGYSILNDVTGINDELKRYSLPPLEYDFYDVQQIYSKNIGVDQQFSLATALDHFKIQREERLHDAETDAFHTMKVFQEILEITKLSVADLLISCSDAKDKCHDYTTDRYEYLLKHPVLIKENNNIIKNKFNRKRYSQLVDNVIPLKKGNDKLVNKKVYISVDYTNYNYVQTLNLIQLITNEAGCFVKSYKDANLYIRFPGEHLNSDDVKIDEFRKSVGPHLKVIEFNELLEILNVSIDDLNELPEESFYFLTDNFDEVEEEVVDTVSFFDLARDFRNK